MLEHALHYASMGWRLFPLSGKIPRTARGVHDATRDESQLRSWWTEWPEAGIGLATGDIVVLDVDPIHDGYESLIQLEKKYGALPPTRASITGSGGAHYFFTTETEIRNTVGLLGYSGLDVRGRGGYVVLPPSRHPNGNHYAWEISSPEEMVRLPDYIREAQKVNVAQTLSEGDIPEFWGEGERNSRLTSLGGVLRRKSLSEAEILAVLREINDIKCKPPLAGDEVERIARSIGRYSVVGVPDSTGRREGGGFGGPEHSGGSPYGPGLSKAESLRNKRRKAHLRNRAWYLPRGR